MYLTILYNYSGFGNIEMPQKEKKKKKNTEWKNSSYHLQPCPESFIPTT